VASHDQRVDPIGTRIGMRGPRAKAAGRGRSGAVPDRPSI